MATQTGSIDLRAAMQAYEDLGKSTASDLEAVRQSIGDLSDDLNETNDAIQGIRNDLEAYTPLSDYIARGVLLDEYLGTNGAIEIQDQALILKNGNFQIVIRGSEIDFMENGDIVAYITGQKLHIPTSEVDSEMAMGNFAWKVRDGRLTLMKVR